MERGRACEILSENMNGIYGFALSRTGNKLDAEDLANDICVQVLSSYMSLKDDGAFYGFMWSVARNTYKKFLRRKKREPSHGGFMDIDYETPESRCVESEEVALLRRELSLLAKKYREVTVAFCIDGKSGAEIARELGISHETVRSILFKVRKMLKEGVEMERNYGERSYNPSRLYTNCWGRRCYLEKLFTRLLPCNITSAAYEKPATIEELSLELGVGTPYLEDELAALLDSGVMDEQGGKYVANVVIMSGKAEKRIYADIKSKLRVDAAKLAGALRSKTDDVRRLDFTGCERTDRRIMWLEAYVTLDAALSRANEKAWERAGGMPIWGDGSECVFWLKDNDNEFCSIDWLFARYSNGDNSARVGVYNYKAIEKCQRARPNWDDLAAFEILADVAAGKDVDRDNMELIKLIDDGIIKADGGKLSANFPVMRETELARLREILADCIELAECAIAKAEALGTELALKSVPKRIPEKGRAAVVFNVMINSAGILVDTLLENGALVLPEEKSGVGMMGVVK